MIKFRVVRWKNFLSTGAQFTEVKLDKSPTTLIVGENGAGKSTILDAICFSLFGKPFRSINKPQLINSINQKQMLVEIEFSIGSKYYKIIRGAKPNVFEIYLNDELLNQDAAARDYQKYLEEHVLKLNYKSFTQIVILGSASFTPFMQLPTGHRREVIEDLLDIKIFTTMNEVLKTKYNEIKESISKIDTDIEIGKNKVKLQQNYIKTLEEDKARREEDTQALITEANANIIAFTSIIDNNKEQVAELKLTISDSDEVDSKYKKLKSLLEKLHDKKAKVLKEIAFYHDNDTCPTCNQNLDEAFKETTIHTHDTKITEIEQGIEEVVKQITNSEERIEVIKKVKDNIADLNEAIIDVGSKLIAEQNYVAKLKKDIDSEMGTKGNIHEEKETLKVIAKKVVEDSSKKTTLVEERHYLDVAGILLKDTGIKTKVIRQYLPVINKLVNKYLQSMDFFVHFELDEAFNETIKSRHRDEFSYASFSEGEKAKIDLALLFAWRSIARMKNSANTNLLMLDEVFDGSLDVNGTDYVMTILNTIGEDNNIFIISHKDALFDKFRSVIRFEKHNNFSQIAK
jgi:DNA repair exonuclease SbcCD ATPase subunit